MIPRRDFTVPGAVSGAGKRRLRYTGVWASPVGAFHRWKHPEGLEVHADEQEGVLHVSVSHRGRDPTTEEVDAVQAFFFPAEVPVQRFCPQDVIGGTSSIRALFEALMAPIDPHPFKVWHLTPKPTVH